MVSLPSLLSLLLFVTLSSALLLSATPDDEQKMYIVYMGDKPKGDLSAVSLHASMLREVVGSRASDSWVRSYSRSFNGFVAKLTKEEAQRVADMDGVVSVFENQNKKLLTTRSWDFMGFPQEATRAAQESDIIVGMLDTGIWPEAKSFDDTNLGSPPTKWKGTCQSGSNFTCNNKLIGARFYHSDGDVTYPDVASPRDTEGHGTHTASTAAGGIAADASMLGLAAGTARGGVPSARIAVYKICWSYGCSDADLLAAFDDAIADGVDIISLSVGGSFPLDYFDDSIAIGAFHAMKNGILTSNSAGNSGPGGASITNFSPWSLSVAASTIDRKFVTKLQLGNNASYEGLSVNTFDMESMYPLIYAGNAPNVSAGYGGSESRYCESGTLNSTLVKGKIVVCDAGSDGSGQVEAGAAGTVMSEDTPFSDLAFTFPLPAVLIPSSGDARYLMQYLNSTSNPTAIIQKSSEIKDPLAPSVVSFSSRGPNPITPDLLKPDLTAPGVDILAAWSQGTTVTGNPSDPRVVPYNIISGTSMSCPHAAGTAAYVKSFHPTWSPAAVKSALMTTAHPMTSKHNKDAEFAYGSGHINPTVAVKPGLVYDAGEADYVNFLCGQGYTAKQLKLVTGDNTTCSAATNGTVWDLNYPSFALSTTDGGEPVTRVFHRTVTNVGFPDSTYTSSVFITVGGQQDMVVTVEPSTLTFTSLGEKQSYAVTVYAFLGESESGMVSATMQWGDGVHIVTSPIVGYVREE